MIRLIFHKEVEIKMLEKLLVKLINSLTFIIRAITKLLIIILIRRHKDG